MATQQKNRIAATCLSFSIAPPPRQQKDLQLSDIAKKCLVIYKLLELQNSWDTLDEELRDFKIKTNEEVQVFLDASLPTNLYLDYILGALDARRQAVGKLLDMLTDKGSDLQVCGKTFAQNGYIANCRQPDKGVVRPNVPKFGSMLQNVLISSSMTKAVQVLRSMLPVQQLTQVLIAQPDALLNDSSFGGISSSSVNVAEISRSPCEENAKENGEDAVFLQQPSQPDLVAEIPAAIQSRRHTAEMPPQPPHGPTLPEKIDPEPLKISEDPPQIRQGADLNIQVTHQKQGTPRRVSKTEEALIAQWTDYWCKTMLKLSASTAEKSKDQRENSVALGEQRGCDTPSSKKQLFGEVQDPFRVPKAKQVEQRDTLNYSWVIANQSELWDFGDVVIDPRCPPSENGISGKEMDEQRQNETSLVNASAAGPAAKTPSVRAVEFRESPGAAEHVDIPPFEIRKFEEMEVVVTHINNPGNFYIQHADSIVHQQALVTDWKGSNSFVEQNCIPEFGTYVMGWFPQQQLWCRAQVTRICGATGGGAGRAANITVEVRRLDYGDTACLSLWNVKAMTPEMAALPLQALQVSLANVTPVDGRAWSEQAVEWLRRIVDRRTLYARLYPEGPRVTVELFLERGKIGSMRRGASLSLRLAQNGHAKHSKLKNVGILPLKRNIPQAWQKKRKPALDKYLVSCYTRGRK